MENDKVRYEFVLRTDNDLSPFGFSEKKTVGNGSETPYFCICLLGFLLKGGFLPYFFVMLSAELQGSIERLIEEKYPQAFVVHMSFAPGKHSVLRIDVDTDSGITLEECMKISRSVGWMIEEEGLISAAYHLEVSSPGVGQPLKLKRQYAANVGRHLAVRTQEGKDLRGKLLEVGETGISLELLPKASAKKKPSPDQDASDSLRAIAFDQILTAKVIIL